MSGARLAGKPWGIDDAPDRAQKRLVAAAGSRQQHTAASAVASPGAEILGHPVDP